MGYFGAFSAKNQGKKILNLWLQVFFYAVISFVLYCIFANNDISLYIIKRTFLPVSTSVYWYITSTLGIYLLQPYTNCMFEKLTRRTFGHMLFVTLGMYCIIPTFIYNENPFMSNLGWLLVLYSIGYYMNKFEVLFEKKKSSVVLVLMWGFMWGMDIILETYTQVEINYFSYMYRVPMLCASVALFSIFLNIEIPYNKIVNNIGRCVLGVYLLHDSLFFRNHFWSAINTDRFYNSFGFLYHMCVVSVFLFVVAIVVEKVRMLIFEKIVYASKWYIAIIDKVGVFLSLE